MPIGGKTSCIEKCKLQLSNFHEISLTSASNLSQNSAFLLIKIIIIIINKNLLKLLDLSKQLLIHLASHDDDMSVPHSRCAALNDPDPILGVQHWSSTGCPDPLPGIKDVFDHDLK